ncbi:MAG TPA: TlpA disulfide reductase family protein [Thermoanaerobaculia bacterium]|nr:TlpA disulfide reductase family protein [Thermoanaerobaculia bacterium]
MTRTETLPAETLAAESRQLSRQTQVLVVALAAAALAVLFWPHGDGTRQAPGGFVIDAGGRPIPVGSRMAPVTLVHFWATWCPPCMTEIPSLDRLSDDFGEYRGDFTILMVAVNDDMERVAGFVGDRISSVLYDPSWEVAHRYGTRKLPETYLVVKGDVVERWIGAQDWNDPGIRRRILDAVRGLRSEGLEAGGSSPT